MLKASIVPYCIHRSTDYTSTNGLQPDMPPELGAMSVKTIIIDANDNAEGIIEFDKTLYEGNDRLDIYY